MSHLSKKRSSRLCLSPRSRARGAGGVCSSRGSADGSGSLASTSADVVVWVVAMIKVQEENLLKKLFN